MRSAVEIVGANAERARGHNRQVVLERIRKAGGIGRAEIARISGLSTQAVSNIIADLLEDGLIEERGRRAGVRGLPAVQYGVNACGGYALGVEIRPDAVFAGVLDLSGARIAAIRRPLATRDLACVTQTVREISSKVIGEAHVPRARLLGAGIVMPGPFGTTGLSGSASELAIWDSVDPAAWFADALGMPVEVENDANAAAVAERVSGVAKGLESYAFLYFGSGLGLGMVQTGRLIVGAFGNAGEIGHVPVIAEGEAVPLEAVVSRLSLQRALAAEGVEVTSGEDIAAAYSDRVPALMDWLDRAAEPLAAAVMMVENLLDPEAVILGGAMPDTVIDHLIRTVPLGGQSVSHRPARAVPRLLAGASGRLTATLGGAALVINRAFTPQIAAIG